MTCRKKGFSLVEILVVIAIVSILAYTIFSVVNSARQKGRDAKRVADIRQINTAIGLYQNDHGGLPPDLGDSTCADFYTYNASCFASSETGAENWKRLEEELKPYISGLPNDPCPSCTAFELFINKAFAYQNFEYVYHAPAAVNAYLTDKGLNPKDYDGQSQTYSIFSSMLEKTNQAFGMGLSVPVYEENNDVPVDVPNETQECPYIKEEGSEDLCKKWELCNKGEEYYCGILKEYDLTKDCPYKDSKEAVYWCEQWKSCNEGNKESCEILTKYE